jgi:NADPH oxidase 5
LAVAPTLALPAAQQLHPNDARLLEVLADAFTHLAGDEQRIGVAKFQQVLGLQSEYLARRIFSLFDSDRNGWIDKHELLDRVRALVFGSNGQKLRFVFDLHDHDEDGLISHQELDRMIRLSLAEDGIAVHEHDVVRLVNALFSRADVNRDGHITFEELEAVVMQHPGVIEQLVRSEARWIAPNEELLARLDSLQGEKPPGLLAALADHRAEVVLLSIYCVANAALFTEAVVRYRDPYANELVQIARGCGACLNFNGALILIPMMRRFLTRIRNTHFGRVLPLDENVAFHRIVGHTMFGFGVLHSAAHLTNYAVASGRPFFDQLLFTKPGLTGLLLLLVFAIMWFFARTAIRRSGHFELFYVTPAAAPTSPRARFTLRATCFTRSVEGT